MARQHARHAVAAWWAAMFILVFPGGAHALDAGDTRVGMTWTKLGHEHVVQSAVAYLGSPYASPDERRAFRWLGQELGCNHICGKSVQALCDTSTQNCGFYTATSSSIAACQPQTCDWRTQGINFATNYLQYYAAVTDYLYDWWICDDPNGCITATDVPFDDIDGFWTRQHHFVDLKWSPTYDGANWWTGNGKGGNGHGGYGWRRSFKPTTGYGTEGDDWAYLANGNDFFGHVVFSGTPTGFPTTSTVGGVWYNGCDSPIHGQYRSLPSPCQPSEYTWYTDTTHYPVTELTRFWFNRFHDGLWSTTPSGAKDLFRFVGMSLHGFGDMAVTQHAHSTMGNNHGEYELWLDQNFFGANNGGKPFNNLEDVCSARLNHTSTLMGRGYPGTWRDAMGYSRAGTASVTTYPVSASSNVQSMILKAGHYAYRNYQNMDVDTGWWEDIGPAARSDSSVTIPTAVATTALVLTKAVNRWYSYYNYAQTPNLTSGSMGQTPACDGHFDVYAIGLEGQLIQKFTDGRFGQGTAGFVSSWNNLSGILLGKPGAVWRAVDTVDVYGIGTDRRIYQRWWNSSSGWSAWNAMGAPTGVLFPYGPDANSMYDGHVQFFAVGNDGNLWNRWWFDYSGWSGWHSTGHPMVGTQHVYLRSAPTSLSWGDGRVDVFAKGSDGNIWQRSFNYGFDWGPWVKLGGSSSNPFDAATGVTAFSGPELLDATSVGSQRIELFALGSDRAVWHRSWDGRWSNWRSLGSQCWSNPTAVASSDGRIALFCRGADRGLYWKFTQATASGASYPHPSGDSWSAWAKFSDDSGDDYYGLDGASPYKPRPPKNETQLSEHAIPLRTGSGSFEFWGDTVPYVNDSGASCGGGAGSPDAVYGLHLDSRSRVVLDLAGSKYDTVLVVKTRLLNTELACNDNSGGTLQSALNLVLEPGDYSIYVDGYSTNSRGGYKLTANVTPLNDTVATAYNLPPNGGTFTGDTRVLTNTSSLCLGSSAPDAVYKLVLGHAQMVRLDTVGSAFRTRLSVTRSDGSLHACSSSTPDGISRLDTLLGPGTFYIYVDGENSGQGTYTLNVNVR